MALLVSVVTQLVSAQNNAKRIEVWLLTADPGGAIVRGVRMGAVEMERTAMLLGRQFELREITATTNAESRNAIAALDAEGRVVSVVLDVPGVEGCELARDLARTENVIVFNARIADSGCQAPWLLLRLPAERRAKALGAREHEKNAVVDEWHSSLTRFGATELNERYLRRTHRPMDGDAWAGWFAAKLAAESALRLDRRDREALLGSTAPSFDGHKGVPLRFDSTGVLQQPVYIIDTSTSAGAVIAEVR